VAASALAATLWADRVGRRRFLVGLAAMTAAGGAAAVLVSDWRWLAAAACLGGLNGMGRDRGAGLVLEQAALPAVLGARSRTRGFAVYNVLQDVGHALGGLVAGLAGVLERDAGMPADAAARAVLWVYPAALLLGALFYVRLSPAVESPRRERERLSAPTRRVLWRLGALFAVDSVAGGFLTTALLTYFFFERFGAGAIAIGALFAAARVLNALSHLGAAWLAGRIGLVNTMVFTHIPSSFLLVSVGFAPSFPVAAVLFLIREALVEMDVPTRQSYVMALVRPEERTTASGVTNLVRMSGWALGPVLTGSLMAGVGLAVPLYIGAGLKIAYDLLLWRSFRHLRAPEERASMPGVSQRHRFKPS
jgi:MFS family permease